MVQSACRARSRCFIAPRQTRCGPGATCVAAPPHLETGATDEHGWTTMRVPNPCSPVVALVFYGVLDAHDAAARAEPTAHLPVRLRSVRLSRPLRAPVRR